MIWSHSDNCSESGCGNKAHSRGLWQTIRSSTMATENDEIFAFAAEALRRKGYYVPETEEEVLKLEKEMDESKIPLPDHLRLADTILLKKRVVFHSSHLEHEDEGYAEHVALAARNGKSIDPEILKRMAIDRAEAEKKSVDTNGETARDNSALQIE